MSESNKSKLLKIYKRLVIAGTATTLIGITTLMAGVGMAVDYSIKFNRLQKEKSNIISEASLSPEWLNYLSTHSNNLKNAYDSKVLSKDEYFNKILEMKSDDCVVENKDVLTETYKSQLETIEERESDIDSKRGNILVSSITGLLATSAGAGVTAYALKHKEKDEDCSLALK